MRVLIYGHSQSEGMGLDVERLLKQAGFSVTRVTKRGYNDRRLVRDVPTLPAGPWDRVILYAGGNSDTPSVGAIRELIGAFGADRTVVVLPPVNVDNPERVNIGRAKNAGNVAGISDLVRVYAIEADQRSFYPDKIHMKPGCPPSKELAGRIVSDVSSAGGLAPGAGGAVGSVGAAAARSKLGPVVLFVGLVALGLYARRRLRRTA